MKKLHFGGEDFIRFSFFALVTLFSLFILTTYLGVTSSNNAKYASSTPIGGKGSFERSQTTAEIKGYYTDLERDVLAVAIKLTENPTTPLPFKSSDYLVSFQGKGEMSGIFGRYGTDGDLFVILPFPKADETYTLYITNKNFLGQSSKNSKVSLKEITGSISSQLSNLDIVGVKSEEEKKETTQLDSIALRVTLNPKLDGDEYKVTTIETESGSLLKQAKDGSYSFDFESYWDYLYRQPLINQAEKNIEESIAKETELTTLYSEFEERFANNPNDTVAEQNMAKYDRLIQVEQDTQQENAIVLDSYRNLTFNESDFSDYTTKIYGIGG